MGIQGDRAPSNPQRDVLGTGPISKVSQGETQPAEVLLGHQPLVKEPFLVQTPGGLCRPQHFCPRGNVRTEGRANRGAVGG